MVIDSVASCMHLHGLKRVYMKRNKEGVEHNNSICAYVGGTKSGLDSSVVRISHCGCDDLGSILSLDKMWYMYMLGHFIFFALSFFLT